MYYEGRLNRVGREGKKFIQKMEPFLQIVTSIINY